MTNNELSNKLNDLFSKFERKPVVFVGSGFEKRYLDSPNWIVLLHYAAKKVNDTKYSLEAYLSRAESYLTENGLESYWKNPVTATLLEKDYNEKFFSDETFEIDIKSQNDELIQRGVSPFKIMVCHYLSEFSKTNNLFDQESEALHNISKRISNIITTNFDGFLEFIFPHFVPVIGQDGLFNSSILSIGNIFKIHGSTSDVQSIVITQKDYQLFFERKMFLSAKLLAFFIENPIIFIGYSIEDANIKQILSDIRICLNESRRHDLSERLFFIEYIPNDSFQEISNIEISDLRMTKVKLMDFNILYRAFESIRDGIDVATLRVLEEKVVQLIQTNSPMSDKVYAAELYDPSLAPRNLAILIGHENSVFTVGYKTITLLDICEDILYDNKNYSPKGIIENTIPCQKTRYHSSKLPLHKYINQYDKALDAFFSVGRIISQIDDIYNEADTETNLYRNPKNQISDLIVEDNVEKSIHNIYLSLKALNVDDVINYLQMNWVRLVDACHRKAYVQTYLTKTVCVIDLIKHK